MDPLLPCLKPFVRFLVGGYVFTLMGKPEVSGLIPICVTFFVLCKILGFEYEKIKCYVACLEYTVLASWASLNPVCGSSSSSQQASRIKGECDKGSAWGWD